MGGIEFIRLGGWVARRVRVAMAALWAMTALAAAQAQTAAAPLPLVQSGRIERLTLPSRHVDARPVDVWLPDGYDPAHRHAVIYLHDGQAVFSRATDIHGGDVPGWRIDAAISRLRSQRAVPEAIVVAIWSDGARRHSEYFPDPFLAHLPAATRDRFVAQFLDGQPRAEAYLHFIVEELKPEIDRRYATQPAREATFIMGSSMGGLISLYALARYPQVFGGAACLSTHWIGHFDDNADFPMAAFADLRTRLQPPAGRRLYMDMGGQGLDAQALLPQAFFERIVRDGGWGPAVFMTRRFPEAGHDTRDWGDRLEVPLRFLLSTSDASR
jgi:predicted alpha/beta superfamily hydrolase